LTQCSCIRAKGTLPSPSDRPSGIRIGRSRAEGSCRFWSGAQARGQLRPCLLLSVPSDVATHPGRGSISCLACKSLGSEDGWRAAHLRGEKVLSILAILSLGFTHNVQLPRGIRACGRLRRVQGGIVNSYVSADTAHTLAAVREGEPWWSAASRCTELTILLGLRNQNEQEDRKNAYVSSLCHRHQRRQQQDALGA